MRLLRRRPVADDYVDPADTPTSVTSVKRLGITDMRGNLLRTTGGQVWAWFVLDEQLWSMQSHGDRAVTHRAMVHAWHGLVGHQIHLRVTSLPYPRNRWMEQLVTRYPGRLQDVPGTPTHADWMRRQQLRIEQARLSLPYRALGVRMNIAPVSRRGFANLSLRQGDALKDYDLISKAIRRPGLKGREMLDRELWWLVHRSVALGVPAPRSGMAGVGEFTPGLMGEFTDPVRPSIPPLGEATVLTVNRDGHTLHRGVVVLSGHRPAPRPDVSDTIPWIPAADRFGFDTEWSIRLDLISAKKMKPSYNERIRVLRHQHKHDLDGQGFAEPAIERAILSATAAEDEVSEGGPPAMRTVGVYRLAVIGSGDTPDKAAEAALARAAQVADYYAEEQGWQMPMPGGAENETGPPDRQYALYREFTPAGQKADKVNDIVTMNNAMWSTGWPAAATTVGDNIGFYLGYTIGAGRRAFMFDPWYPITQQHRGAAVMSVAKPGGGKSHKLGAIAANVTKMGIRTVVSDPSGPLAKLCDMPEFQFDSEHINLTAGNTQRGLLNPTGLVPVPARSLFDSDAEWRVACEDAEGERLELVLDVMKMLLDADTARQSQTNRVLAEAAISANMGAYGANPWLMLSDLRDKVGTDQAKLVASLLEVASRTPAGRLVFPEHHRGDAAVVENLSDNSERRDPTLTVITAAGLTPPPENVDPVDWGVNERLAKPVRHLANHFSSRVVYSSDRSVPKLMMHDEIGTDLATFGSGRALLNREFRDSRKMFTCVVAATQLAGDMTRLGGEGLAERVFVGATKETQAAAALQLLGAPAGYEHRVLGLGANGPGDFLYRDSRGRIEAVHIDTAHWPELEEQLAAEYTSRRVEEWTAGVAM